MAAADFGLPRHEYPRPQFTRPDWLCLNGWWEFEQDPEEVGLDRGWHHGHPFSERILVPYPVESRLSGIGDRHASEVVWYRRAVAVPASFAGRRLMVRLGAVDYATDVWWSGCHLGHHDGGHTPFAFEVPAHALAGASVHELVVRAEDRRERAQPRGKQYWHPESEEIFYTRTTGIWQTVWLEPLPDLHLTEVRCRPVLADGSVRWRLALDGPRAPGAAVEVSVWQPDGPLYGRLTVPADAPELEATLIPQAEAAASLQPWSPEAPNLYAVRYRILQGAEVVDAADGYLGFRQLEARGGQLLLNGRPYFLKMVLDQGYFPDGILTAPTAADLRRDVELCKAMGFNGARKHQKLEDPQWLYWCDRLGLLAWGEMANAWDFTPRAARRLAHEWAEAVARDANHPALVAWVPVNESWGVPNLDGDPAQVAYLDALYALTKAMDPSRLVVANDGWEHGGGDLATLHDYEGDPAVLQARYAQLATVLAFRPSGRALYAPGRGYRGQPVLVTEMGGLALKAGAARGGHWGYTELASAQALLERYRAQVAALASSPLVQGFCYTQLTDVEQEVNGLLTDRREPKVPLEALWAANQLGR